MGDFKFFYVLFFYQMTFLCFVLINLPDDILFFKNAIPHSLIRDNFLPDNNHYINV